ncbi:precorrin-2 dehydrogenase/sirohydrochlorin ferrochelatase family protein [Raoultibacter phocaeensis]|uniref:precorrin-2 dehydrogenase/sirohydrochlorin ferrochelatase family protein n=1 Tax=Raoultibacter phocaeensis TaxID=2479841 RepID=UPI0015D637DD|nr:bifunctional precorrin-2 dehydrogenase/sirohydrochlorin ferrochelatase [Raoultibacter phocaeensis]
MLQTYPVSLVLEGRTALVVGGGAVATRKVEGLVPCGASIAVVSPELTETLHALACERRIEWRPRAYTPTDLQGADIVFVATDDEAANARVYRDAAGKHLMVNVADRPELCTFFLPSVMRRGKLSVAVSTEGASPLTARRLRAELEERIPEGYEGYLDALQAQRSRVIEALPDEGARARFWQQVADSRMFALVSAGEQEAARALFESLLSEALRETEPRG